MALKHMTMDHGWEINVKGAETAGTHTSHTKPPSHKVRLNGHILFKFLTSITDTAKSHVKTKNNHMRLSL